MKPVLSMMNPVPAPWVIGASLRGCPRGVGRCGSAPPKNRRRKSSCPPKNSVSSRVRAVAWVWILTTVGVCDFAMFLKVEASIAPFSGAPLVAGTLTCCADEPAGMSKRDAITMPTATAALDKRAVYVAVVLRVGISGVLSCWLLRVTGNGYVTSHLPGAAAHPATVVVGSWELVVGREWGFAAAVWGGPVTGASRSPVN